MIGKENMPMTCFASHQFPKQPTLSDRLIRSRDELKQRLTMTEKAIEALEKNPNIKEAIDLISQLGL